MTSVAAEERSKRMIHTAGCIIIGDEVLGGKVPYAPVGNMMRIILLAEELRIRLSIRTQRILPSFASSWV